MHHGASVSCTYARARIVGHSGLFFFMCESTIVYAAYTALHICYSAYLTSKRCHRKERQGNIAPRISLTRFKSSEESHGGKSVQGRENPCYPELVGKMSEHGDKIRKWIVAFSLPLCRFVDLGFSPLAGPPMQHLQSLASAF